MKQNKQQNQCFYDFNLLVTLRKKRKNKREQEIKKIFSSTAIITEAS